MGLIQMISARLATIDELIFYAFDDAGVVSIEDSRRLSETLLPVGTVRPVRDLLWEIDDLAFSWGNSDGN